MSDRQKKNECAYLRVANNARVIQDNKHVRYNMSKALMQCKQIFIINFATGWLSRGFPQ
jgi:hypothetical protein